MVDYKIYIKNNDEELVLFQLGDSDLALGDVHWKPSIGNAGSLEFSLRQSHPYFNKIKPMATDFILYKNDEPVFRGRYVGAEEDYLRTGRITAEGSLNFFIDSVQMPFEYEGLVRGLIEQIVENHNGIVEERKRFTVGTVDVVTSGEISLKNENYSTSIECLQSIANMYGGYFVTRYEDGVNYLDYVINFGVHSNQPIKFGENLVDISKNIDTSSIVTCLIPLGAKIDTVTADGTTSKPLDIKAVNDGVDYITNERGIAEWGQIWTTKTWDYITDAQELKDTARAWLAQQIALPATITLTAVDLAIVDENFDSFNVGTYVNVESTPHGVSGQYLLQEMDINISDPSQSTVNLGGKTITMSANVAKASADITKGLEELSTSTSNIINERVNNATQLITGGLGGYVVIHRDTDGHPDEILIMDTDTTTTAKNVIRFNKNGIGFSTTGYNGTYRNAWTIDGNLVADFITTGKMAADRIKGGTLEVGGSGFARNGTIVVKDANNNQKVLINKDGIQISGGKISASTIEGSSIKGSSIHGSVSISCGDQFYVNATDQSQDAEFTLGDWSIGKEDNGKYSLSGPGVIYCHDIYPTSSWWSGWGLTETVEALWEKVFNE